MIGAIEQARSAFTFAAFCFQLLASNFAFSLQYHASMTTRRRRLLKWMCGLLALGAIINIAAAWVCVLLAIKTGVAITSDGLAGKLHPLSASELNRLQPGVWPLTHDRIAIWVLRGTAPGVQMRNAISVPGDYGTAQYRGGENHGLMREITAGWPLPSMQGWHRVNWEGASAVSQSPVWLMNVSSNQHGGSGPMNPTALPFKPMGPGFILNTLVFAIIIALLFSVPRAVLRRRRLRQGLCPSCGYPMGSSEQCSECGETLPAIAG